MRLLMLHAVDYPAWRDTRVVMPEAGIAVLVGPNGSGKTALGVDAAGWAIWGETARGWSPATAHVFAEVEEGGRVYGVGRQREAGRGKALTFAVDGVDHSGQTPTETQARICAVLGDWRRHASTRVFSRALTARFALATNKERQVLLSSVLGLEQFARAEKVARAALGDRKALVSKAMLDLGHARGALERSRQAVQGEAPPLAALEEKVWEAEKGVERTREAGKAALAVFDKLVAQYEQVAKRQREEDQAIRRATDELGRANSAASRYDEDDDEIEDKAEVCPYCDQVVDGAARRAICSRYEAEAERAGDAVRVHTEARDTLAPEVADLGDQVKDARGKVHVANGALADAQRRQGDAAADLKVARSKAEQRAKALAAADDDQRAVDGAELAQAKAEHAAKVAELACEVLGPRGARVRALDASLRRLEAEANAVLERLGTPVRLRVGARDDEVQVGLDGAGGGRYEGASDGERARVDVAILLALSRLAGGRGTLFFDEVFDSLDDDGLDRVAELLGEMAHDRLVVVTSHDLRLQGLVPASSVWRVERGEGGASRLVVPGAANIAS